MNHTCRWMHTRKIKGQACDRKLRFWSQHGYFHSSTGMLFICRRLLRLLKKGENVYHLTAASNLAHSRNNPIQQCLTTCWNKHWTWLLCCSFSESSTSTQQHEKTHMSVSQLWWGIEKSSYTEPNDFKTFRLTMALHSSANATQKEFGYRWFVKVGNKIGKAGIHCHLHSVFLFIHLIFVLNLFMVSATSKCPVSAIFTAFDYA